MRWDGTMLESGHSHELLDCLATEMLVWLPWSSALPCLLDVGVTL